MILSAKTDQSSWLYEDKGHMKKKLTVWITKHALTKGIYSTEAVHSELYPNMIEVPNGSYSQYFHGRDWHLNEAAAKERAEAMRRSAIALLDKKRAKLVSMTF